MAKDKVLSTSGIKSEFEKIVMSFTRAPWEVYCDFLQLAIDAFLSDHTPEHPREKDYMKIIGKYSHDEAQKFGDMLGLVFMYMRDTGKEFLANMWMQLAANSNLGQFFTPPVLCDLMSQINYDAVDWDKYSPEKPCCISDPACGGGLTLFYAVKKFPVEKRNSLFIHGVDVDINVCHCAALNMLFLNVDAVIIHGNTLTMEVWHVFRIRHHLAGGEIYEVKDPEQMRRWMEFGFRRDGKGCEKSPEKPVESAPIAENEIDSAVTPKEEETTETEQEINNTGNEDIAKCDGRQLLLF